MKSDAEILRALDAVLNDARPAANTGIAPLDIAAAAGEFINENLQRIGELANDAVLMRYALREIVSMTPQSIPGSKRKQSAADSKLTDIGMIARAAVRPKPFGAKKGEA